MNCYKMVMRMTVKTKRKNMIHKMKKGNLMKMMEMKVTRCLTRSLAPVGLRRTPLSAASSTNPHATATAGRWCRRGASGFHIEETGLPARVGESKGI